MYQNILFDLDGTLTQSEFGIIESVKHSIQKMGMEEREDSFYLPFIGPPLFESYKKYCGMTDSQAVEATAYYRAYYCAGAYKNAPLYEGITELLQELCRQDKKLYLATAKPINMARAVLEHHDLQKYFTGIFGPTEAEKSPSKAELVAKVIQMEQLDVSASVMIGDRMYDMDAGWKNHMDTIGVLYGYGTEEELKAHQATYLAYTPREIYEVIIK